MNVLRKTPIELPKPNRENELIHSLPETNEHILWVFNATEEKEENKKQKRIQYKVKENLIGWKVTVFLSWETNEKLVRNWMVKHMEAYPESAKWFYAQFIDYPRDEWYIVKPCDTEKNDTIKINWINYRIYPLWSNLSGLINIFTSEISEILNSSNSLDEIEYSIQKEVFDVLSLAPVNKEITEKIKDELIKFLSNDPNLNKDFVKKYKITNYLNDYFNIVKNSKEYK